MYYISHFLKIYSPDSIFSNISSKGRKKCSRKKEWGKVFESLMKFDHKAISQNRKQFQTFNRCEAARLNFSTAVLSMVLPRNSIVHKLTAVVHRWSTDALTWSIGGPPMVNRNVSGYRSDRVPYSACGAAMGSPAKTSLKRVFNLRHRSCRLA